MKRQYFDSVDQLRQYILEGIPSIYLGAQTSTVIPFENLSDEIKKLNFCFLEKLPQKMQLLENGDLEIEGPVNWLDARAYLRSKGRDLLTAPTEELAGILSGIATSATGERCFGYGTFRSQVKSLEFINHKAEIIKLDSKKPFNFGDKELRLAYQHDCKRFNGFKNPPFPNFDNELDLMVGTEGQLGVITKAVIQTKALDNSLFLMLPIDKWNESFEQHQEIFNKVQSYRDDLICVELLDHNCIDYLDKEDNIAFGYDYIVLEVSEESLEKVFEKLLSEFDFLDIEKVVELSSAKFMSIRQKIPRTINEKNSQAGIKKLGTDIQALGSEFVKLIDEYRYMSTQGVTHCLFGHFGDGHLHFNFMPTNDQAAKAKSLLVDLYKKLSTQSVSPFAEHGIGVIKQDFIKDYYSPIQTQFFKSLKAQWDPANQFFPQGFMNIDLSN